MVYQQCSTFIGPANLIIFYVCRHIEIKVITILSFTSKTRILKLCSSICSTSQVEKRDWFESLILKFLAKLRKTL